MPVQFEWDADKAALNLKKHGVDFRDAVRVFYDVNRIEWYDSAHSDEEDRLIPLAWFEKSSSSCTQSAVKEPALFPPERPRPEKGESTMIVTYNLKPNTPLTPEQIKRLDALKDRPIVFDEDCPEMTDEQLRQFKRVHPHREDTAPDRKLG